MELKYIYFLFDIGSFVDDNNLGNSFRLALVIDRCVEHLKYMMMSYLKNACQ
jgi:hypothetical protein